MKDLDNTTEQVGSLKKRELCKRKQPHDFVLTLPSYLRRLNPDATPEQAELYYASRERCREFELAEIRSLEKQGIFQRTFSVIHPVGREYECSGCGRLEYNLKIKK